jgi:hypothetical protein
MKELSPIVHIVTDGTGVIGVFEDDTKAHELAVSYPGASVESWMVNDQETPVNLQKKERYETNDSVVYKDGIIEGIGIVLEVESTALDSRDSVLYFVQGDHKDAPLWLMGKDIKGMAE